MPRTADRRKKTLRYLRGLITFISSCLLALLYSALIGLISGNLRGAFIAFPIWIVLLCFVFWKWNLLRFSGYLAVVPVTILAFEIFRTLIHPPIYAHDYKVLDRSHFKPGVRLSMPEHFDRIRDDQAWGGVKEILIGKHGFRADPDTGLGNPWRCNLVLIGDSMIYGSGLAYSDTLRPVLGAMGADACVFGVSGNTPLGYLATLRYVGQRIEKDGHIAIYLYAYNDFLTLSKYLTRRGRALSSSFVRLSKLMILFDEWRQTTYTYGLFRQESTRRKRPPPLWRLKIGEGKTLEFYYPRNPAVYVPPPRLSMQQNATLRFFFDGLREVVGNRPWRVSVVIIPDNPEMMVNFAKQAPTFQDLDQRRMDALKICRELWSSCEDLGPYLHKRTMEEGKNPYFIDNRHFSAFGTRLVAEHYVAVAKKTVTAPIGD